MEFFVWLVVLVLLSTQPLFVFRHDRRNFDGYRYVELCGGLYQRPETWACIEVSR